MSAPRISQEELNKIINKKGYGIASSISGGIGKTIKAQRAIDQAGGEGAMSLLERSSGSKSVRPKNVAVPYSGRCDVRIKVYRQRLTDTGNDCYKYHLDACRYTGWLVEDNDAAIRLTEEPHEKVATKDEERVEITITYYGIDLDDLVEFYKNGPQDIKFE